MSAATPAASAAVQALDRGDVEEARRILDASEQLGRHVFSAPTYHYKTGVAFLAWLNGHQKAFTMVGGMHSARSLQHLSRTIELAAETGNDEATSRLRKVVDVDDPGTGKVRLKASVDRLDEMALDTASTTTTRIRKDAR